MREKNMRYIEDAVDSLSAGIKPSFKRTRKIVKPLTLVLVVLVSASVAIAGVMTYYSKIIGSHGIGHVWTYVDNIGGSWNEPQLMEELNVAFDTVNTVGGNNESFLFNVTLSGHSQASKSLRFVLTEDLSNGVNLTVSEDGVEIVNDSVLEFTPGETRYFKYQVDFDDYIESGDYSTSLQLLKP